MPNLPRSDLATQIRHLTPSTNWLLLLRWVAVIGQLMTIAIVRYGLGVELPMVPLMTVIGITAASNLAFAIWVRQLPTSQLATLTRQHPIVLACVMALDLLLLSSLLYFAGGPANPFSIFYLVNLTLGAVVLSERWGWLLTAVALVGMLVVVFYHVNIPGLTSSVIVTNNGKEITLEQMGRVVAMVACALVIVHFVSRLTRQLEITADELRRVERDRSRSEKLEALGTLAGGAAHELSTPLSTIAVVSKEMLRHLQDIEVPDLVREDVSLIRSQVDHCQAILQRMTGRAGQWMAEQHIEQSLDELLEYTVDELVEKDRVRRHFPVGGNAVMLDVPRESTTQALRGLLQNGLDATPSDTSIDFHAEWDDEIIRLRIRDYGPGMTDDVLERAGEPFFTTKDPGRGMGLGIFLTRSVVERLGGQLTLHSEPGKGVTALVELPRTTGVE